MVLIAAIGIVAAGGIGYTAIPGADGQIKGCYAKTNGILLGSAGLGRRGPDLDRGAGTAVGSTLHGGLARLDPETLEVLASADLGYQDHVGEVAVGEDRIWYPTYGGDEVLEVRSDFSPEKPR